MPGKQYISLQFNCGFARCAVWELMPKDVIDKAKRSSDFQALFTNCPNYSLSQCYFEANSDRPSLLSRHCDNIIQSWGKQWHPTDSRRKYENTFSVSNWKALPLADKQKHTLACCKQCSDKHLDLQQKFPLKPHHVNEAVVSINLEALRGLENRKEQEAH